ncbi:ATP-binding protein [Geodermatophilus sp. SYSU D00766]
MDLALVNTIGLHHSLATAVADLVDNSLDATAGAIRVRFLLDGVAPVALQVIDDGYGMDSLTIDKAMTYAGRRDYHDTDLGHFGVGLKAASLSQANTVLVYSRAYGASAVGRMLVREGDMSSPRVGELSAGDAEQSLAEARFDFAGGSGTIVEWRDVRTFPATTDKGEQMRWLEGAVRDVRNHLGLVLHRLLDGEGPRVLVDSQNIRNGELSAARAVTPIDPFGYRHSGDPDFPADLRLEMPDGSAPVSARAYVWPPRSQDPGFKLGGRPGEDAQGFFVYRRNRLLQGGGWCDLWGPRPEWGLARVELDLGSTADAHVTINPEKSGITFSSDLRRALEKATCAGTGLTFTEYLQRAAGEDKRSRQRQRRPITVVEPRGGLHASVLDSYQDAVEFDPDAAPIDLVWRTLPPDQVFEIDLDNAVLALNLRYRTVLVGHPSLDTDDAPVLKTLLHLLANRYFDSSYLGAKEKRELDAWQAILLAAVRAQAGLE